MDDDFEKLRADLLRAVRWKCPPRLAAQAEDIVQTAILRVLERHRETGDSYPFEYYRRAAFNVIFDEIRRRQEIVGALNGPTEPRDPKAADQDALVKDLGDAVRACLKTMAADRRRAVVLRIADHSVPYIAAQLQVSLKQADNLIFRGRRDLRDCLRARGVNP